MALDKPYFRIIRPFLNGDHNYIGSTVEKCYLESHIYAPDRKPLVRAYKTLEKDLIELFDYIEPCDANLNCYSYRTYELLLRASTEFETNSKVILKANDYQRRNGWNITDYYKINNASKLSEHQLKLRAWSPVEKSITPFTEWITSHTLTWYQNYNYSKHDRNRNFHLANLENLINAVAAVFAILFSQFHLLSFNAYETAYSYSWSDDEFYSDDNSIFAVKLPVWQDSEMYNFDWQSLNTDVNPIEKFRF